MTNKPPYPTEDLIRRSALYQMMTQPLAVSKPAPPASEPVQDATEIKAAVTAPVRGRRRAADKSKLLELDLNPDM